MGAQQTGYGDRDNAPPGRLRQYHESRKNCDGQDGAPHRTHPQAPLRPVRTPHIEILHPKWTGDKYILATGYLRKRRNGGWRGGMGTGKGIADCGLRIGTRRRAGTGTREREDNGRNGGNRQPGTGNRKRRTASEVAIMARHRQVLPPVPAPGSNTLCMVMLLSIAVPELPVPGTPPELRFLSSRPCPRPKRVPGRSALTCGPRRRNLNVNSPEIRQWIKATVGKEADSF